MEEYLEFKFPEYMTERLDQLNGVMEFIVNRAAAEVNDSKNIGLLNKEDSLLSFITYRVANIVAVSKGTSLFLTKELLGTAPWIDKTSHLLFPLDKENINKIEIIFTGKSDENFEEPGTLRIFRGIRPSIISEIAIDLYGYKEEVS